MSALKRTEVVSGRDAQIHVSSCQTYPCSSTWAGWRYNISPLPSAILQNTDATTAPSASAVEAFRYGGTEKRTSGIRQGCFGL